MGGWQTDARPRYRESKWFLRLEGELLEVRRLTRPHRERSLILVSVIRWPGFTSLVETRDLIQA